MRERERARPFDATPALPGTKILMQALESFRASAREILAVRICLLRRARGAYSRSESPRARISRAGFLLRPDSPSYPLLFSSPALYARYS